MIPTRFTVPVTVSAVHLTSNKEAKEKSNPSHLFPATKINGNVSASRPAPAWLLAYMPLDLEREYTVTHSRVLDKDVFFLVAQKSKDQVVQIMQKYGDDRIGFRNAMFDDIFIFIKGCAVIKAYKEDVEAMRRRFERKPGDQ